MQKKSRTFKPHVNRLQHSRRVSIIPAGAFLFVLLSLMLPLGCTIKQKIQIVQLKGFLAWKQGDWNNAVMHFSEAEDIAVSLSDTDIRHYTDFALASTYLMQGEDKAAAGKLRNISETAAEILGARRFYQQGIIAFRAKEYAEAAALFRKSLELAETDTDAKINYELSKRLCDTQRDIQHGAPQQAAEETSDFIEDSIILDIIRKREQSEWKKIRHETEPAINDY